MYRVESYNEVTKRTMVLYMGNTDMRLLLEKFDEDVEKFINACRREENKDDNREQHRIP